MPDQDFLSRETVAHFRGAKLALRPMHVWALRVRLQLARRIRDLALFDLALDSKLRGCDVVTLRLNDIIVGGTVRCRAMVLQRKTGRPVQFEITDQTRRSLSDWLQVRKLSASEWIFPSRMRPNHHLSTRQYARLVKQWVALLGLAWMAPAMPPTASVARKSRSSIERPVICAPASFFWATQSWRVPSDI